MYILFCFFSTLSCRVDGSGQSFAHATVFWIFMSQYKYKLQSPLLALRQLHVDFREKSNVWNAHDFCFKYGWLDQHHLVAVASELYPGWHHPLSSVINCCGLLAPFSAPAKKESCRIHCNPKRRPDFWEITLPFRLQFLNFAKVLVGPSSKSHF